jgi:hypothetical protein
VIVPAEECLLCRITTPSAAGATSTQFSPLLLRLEIRHARRSAVVISVLQTRLQGLDACDDGIDGIGLRQRCCAPPIRRQSTRPDLILILDVDGTSGVLDVADALGFVEVQQQEVTVEPVVNGDGDRRVCRACSAGRTWL